MDVFKVNEQPKKIAESQTTELKEERMKRREKPVRPLDQKYLKDPRIHKNQGPINFDPEHVRGKVQRHVASQTKVEISSSAKAQKIQKAVSDKLPPGAKSDLSDNDPSNPMTREKLSGLMGKGAVNFDSKTKEVLSKILGK